MGKIVTNGQLASTQSNVRRQFLTDFDRQKAVMSWREIATVVPSTTATEEQSWMGSTPTMKDTTKGKVEMGGVSPYDYSLTNRTWQSGISFDRSWWEDDKMSHASLIISSLAEEAAANRGRQILGLFESGGLAYDGTAYFANTRVQGSSANIDNKIAESVTDTGALTIAEVHAIINATIVQMGAFQDDKGVIQGRMPDTFVVPLSLYTSFYQGLASNNQQGSVPGVPPSNPTGMLQVGGYRLLLNHQLSSAVKLYALSTGGTMKPFVFQERQQPQVDGITNVESREWMIERSIPYVATDRFEVGYGDPRNAVEVTIS